MKDKDAQIKEIIDILVDYGGGMCANEPLDVVAIMLINLFATYQDEWISVSEKPECKEGSLIYIQVATKNRQTGKYIVYGGVYLNKYELMDINDDEIKYFTGFHCESKHSDFDQYFEPIKADFWQYFTQPQTSKDNE